MKKTIIAVAAIICIGLAAIITYNYLSVPKHVRNGEDNAPDHSQLASSWADERVKSAIAAGKESIMEDSGLDIPFSADLLGTVEQHFQTDMELLGAGIYRGTINEDVAVELLLNPAGKVGQVQLCISETAKLEDSITAYARFVNKDLEDRKLPLIVEEALPRLQNIKGDETYTYYNYGVGFCGKVESNQLVLYLP